MEKINLDKLSTEKRNISSMGIDKKSTLEICKIINDQDITVPLCVQKVLNNIASVIDQVVIAFQNNGRLIYTGAGTSGRIGLIDAVECRPTYSCPDEMVQCVMAGGKEAFVRAKEGAEDSKELAVEELKNINLNKNDILIGIAASGRTPYVIGAIEYAKSLGCVTCSIATVENSKIGAISDYKIEAVTGAEVVTGSTRMKAGTAQKLICNMITTASMIKMGKVYDNYMVDVKATNEKLVKRASNIIKDITGATEDECDEALKKYKTVKKAIISILLNIEDEKEIEDLLEKNKGMLRPIIEMREKND